MGKLEGKVAIVTGGGQGIGRGVALAMAKEGAIVIITEINDETAAAMRRELEALGKPALALHCDVSQRQEVSAAVAATVKKFGAIDILINNALATQPGVPLEETTDELLAMTMGSGFYGTFYFMQACFPYLKNKGGKIINFGSRSGLEGQAGLAAYAASKEAIRALTRVAAREWGQYKINVNCVCPFANSPSVQAYAEAFPEDFKTKLAEVPLGRVGNCELDIGRVVAFLAGPESDYITGMTIMVDGGQYMLR